MENLKQQQNVEEKEMKEETQRRKENETEEKDEEKEKDLKEKMRKTEQKDNRSTQEAADMVKRFKSFYYCLKHWTHVNYFNNPVDFFINGLYTAYKC